jgi:hypothetical protein
MKSILLILTICSFNTIYGQSGLTSYPADIPLRDSLNVELINIEKTEFAFYFRLLLSGQTVNIFSQDKKIFHGVITNSVKEYEQVKVNDQYRRQATKLYSEQVRIDSSLATSIASKIIESGQISIPTDSLIDSWTRLYLHCGSLNFEIKNDNNFVKQSFHCPWNQPDSVEYKNIILSNYNLLKQELNLDSIYQIFWTQLPKGKTYSRSGYGMTYKLTDKQEEAWKKGKPKRDYLKSIKDSVDNYLNYRLDSLQETFDSTSYSCYNNYQLAFAKNGRLKKIYKNRHDRMKITDGLTWYIEDHIETWRCHKQIKKIFKKVNLSSFDLEYEVYRTFHFDLGEGWMITDNTIY